MVANVDFTKTFVGGVPPTLDSAGDEIRYTFSIQHISGENITDLRLSDSLLGLSNFNLLAAVTAGTLILSGDDGDGIFEAGETWTFTESPTSDLFTYVTTQADYDSNGTNEPDPAVFGDPAGQIDNEARLTTFNAQGVQQTASLETASVEIVYNPDFSLTKVATSITGGAGTNGLDGADSAGDIINYTITIGNTGNISLTGFNYTDLNANGDVITYVSGDGGTLGVLDVGETWIYSAAHTVTQAEIDGNGTSITGDIDGDGDTDNRVIVDFNEAGPKNADAVTLILNPNFSVAKVATSITGGVGTNGLDGANSAGDLVNYTITIANTGNVALTGFNYTDLNADGDVITYVSGDGGTIGVLDVGETWIYSAAHTVTQAELDSRGTDDTGALDTDNDTDNKVVVDFDQVGPKNASAVTPLIYNPDFTVAKTATSITGGVGTNGLDGANSAGDLINYSITIANTGNISLTGFNYTDLNANGDVITYVSGDAGTIGVLDVGETWIYSAAHTVTQAELDSRGTDDTGTLDTDNDTDNKVVVDFDQVGPKNASAVTPLIYNPNFTVVKTATSITGGVGTNGLDGADSAGDLINYSITIANTGNISLTGFNYTDLNANGDVITYVSGDGGTIGVLDVGETWIYSAAHTVTQAEIDGNGTSITGDIDGDGDTDNRVIVDFNEVGPKQDDEVTLIIQPQPEGPGVGTPGFWANNGARFWDGVVGNEGRKAGTPGFADGELLYAIAGFGTGLLVGDYNFNGLTDAGEDTLYISLADARSLISGGGGSDGANKLGRDVVATWLNHLAGNGINNPGAGDDGVNPMHFIDDAIDWLQVYGDASASNTNVPGETFDSYSSAHAKVSGAAFNNVLPFMDHSASQVHSALDQYNNTGFIGAIQYAQDRDFFG